MASNDATQLESVATLRLQLSNLQNENEAIREERDRFRSEIKAFRMKVSVLESQVEELEIESRDLRRKLSRVEAVPPDLKAVDLNDVPKEVARITQVDATDRVEGVAIQLVAVPPKETQLRLPPSPSLSTKTDHLQEAPAAGLRAKRAIDAVDDVERSTTKVRRENSSLSGTPYQHMGKYASLRVSRFKSSKEPTPTTNSEGRISIRAPTFPTKSSSSTSASPRYIAKRREGLKVEADALVIPSFFVFQHIGNCTPFRITPPLSTTLFKRDFLTQTLNSNSQSLRTMSNYKNRKLLFPTLDSNPDTPSHPGYPGLMVCPRTDVIGTFTVFSRVQVRPPMWEYMGEYRTSNIGLLPASMFCAQTDEVKAMWAKIIDTQSWNPYPAMRARIEKRKKRSLKQADIIEALEEGTEQLGILKMECVLYDHRFVSHLLENLKDWKE